MEVRAPWHEPSYFFLPCWQDVSKLITFLIPQTTHILATTKSIMPHLERVPSEYSFPTPKNGLGTPSSMESSPPNAVSPDVKSTSNVVLQNRHQVRCIQLTLTCGPRTFAEHIANQKDLCKIRRKKSALGKATIAYRQQKLSRALDDEMCNALDVYEKSPRKRKVQTTIEGCKPFYVTDFSEHAPATESISVSESTLVPDKNTQQGLSGPNELNWKRGKSVILPVPVFSSTVKDQPSFTLIHQDTETEISMNIASASDVDTLLPMVLSSWHVRRTLCTLSPRDSTC